MSVTGAVADAASPGRGQRGTVRGDAMLQDGAVLREGAVLRGDAAVRGHAMLREGVVLRGDAAVRAR
ncbi:hypothetical protein ACFYOK_32740 [Microbispora bryophytorum]|uniref:hypothetical protein n=1 Tax=Microbispora bryophytorum TaxID=1460882 RepID=UPI0033D73BAD